MSAHEPVMAESDNPNNTLILGAVIVCIVLVVGIVVGVAQFYGFAVRDELAAKVLSPESTQLREQRAKDQQRLSNYQWVDKSANVVRVPLERAKELTLRDWAQRPAGVVGAGGQPVAPPAETVPVEGTPPEGAAPAPAPEAPPGN